MKGFHILESLWKISYSAEVLEPFLTAGVGKEELKERLSIDLGTKIELIPLIIENKAVLTGNAMKGVFRHLISAQLANAGHKICVQDVKSTEAIPKERKKQCDAKSPCFVCEWFGTVSRQGALSFSFLESDKPIKEVLYSDPVPMVALTDEYLGASTVKKAFLTIAPVRKGASFNGYIKGENLNKEIIGALKEVVDMSEKGFVQFGGLKSRGYGAIKLNIDKIEKYSTKPFQLDTTYISEPKGEKNLIEFLNECQKEYHKFLTSIK